MITRRAVIGGYERALLLDPEDDQGELLRARALYVFGWAIALTQVLNMIGMRVIYGAWTLDHAISVLVIAIVLGAVHCLRFYRNFAVYAAGASVLCASGPLMTALYDYTGINTSLLPFLVAAPMLAGFISGWRAAVCAGVLCLASTGFLYWWSASNPAVEAAFYAERTALRAMQAAFAIFMTTVISSVFSANIHRAFRLLRLNAERAKRAEKVKTDFLATMSHELRTPLNGVLGSAEALRGLTLSAEQARLADTISDAGQSLLVVVDDLLDITKLNSDQIVVSEREFHPHLLLQELDAKWRAAADNRALAFSVECYASVPDALIGDDFRIKQVLSGLIANALKFTKAGFVSLTATAEPTRNGVFVSFSVTDTGCGVAVAKRERIFEMFEQGEQGATRSFDGAGVGLYLARRMARLMGGDLTVRSVDAAGSTFTLRLPMQVTTPACASEGESDACASEPSAFRLLIVEDNPTNQLVASALATKLGADCAVVENGALALEKLATQSFDLVLMDKHMPVMDGVEATRRIRASGAPYAAIPVIACTADIASEDREELHAAGFTDFLPKPINTAALKEAFGRALGAHRTAA